MKTNNIALITAILAVSVSFAACGVDEKTDKCTDTHCIDASTLLVCDPDTGTTTEKKCECDLINNACKDTPIGEKCTANKCKDANTLLVCNTVTGTTTEKTCECDVNKNACNEAPIGEKCTADKCKDANTLLVCNTVTGTTTEKTCECDLNKNACNEAPIEEKCTADICKDASTLLVCDTTTGTTTEKACECDLKKNTCKEAPIEEKCTADICKDASTLLVCDTSTGQTSEKACECDLNKNECKEAPIEEKCTADKCKDANILLVCDKGTGQTSEKECDCDLKNNKCKEAPTEEKCTKDVCADAKTLMKCNSGNAQKQSCASDEICTFGKCEKKSLDDFNNCKKETKPVCIGDTIYKICDTMNEGETYEPIFHHCIPGTICQNGACIPEKTDQCIVTACKDLDNIAECNDGVATVKPCGKDKICMQDACVDAHGVKSCTKDEDCGDSSQTCYSNVCYTKSNFDLEVGDTCDSATFEEYCKGNIEYKCGYDKTVETNDCTNYNGCGLMFQKAFSLENTKSYPIRNAACRGDSERLAECEHAGTTNVYCMNYDDPEYGIAFSYSYQDKCIVGTDGKMIFGIWSVETECSDKKSDKCDKLTGLCIK